MLQPFAVADEVLDFFRRYVRAGFPLRNPSLDAQREQLIDEGLLWREPFVSLGRPGTTGPRLDSLKGLLLDRTLEIPWGFDVLYQHQHEAIQRLSATRDRRAAEHARALGHRVWQDRELPHPGRRCLPAVGRRPASRPSSSIR